MDNVILLFLQKLQGDCLIYSSVIFLCFQEGKVILERALVTESDGIGDVHDDGRWAQECRVVFLANFWTRDQIYFLMFAGGPAGILDHLILPFKHIYLFDIIEFCCVFGVWRFWIWSTAYRYILYIYVLRYYVGKRKLI